MRGYAITLAFAMLPASMGTAAAFDRQVEAILKRLDPEARWVQACNIEAMERIDRDPGPFSPDRVMIDHLASPTRRGNVLQGSGGVFRSKGQWYHLSYTCEAAPDRLKVLSFRYRVGALIPKSQWEELSLFP